MVDASVIIAGLLSPTGRSAKILQACCDKKLVCFISSVIQDEVKRNLSQQPDLVIKLESYCYDCFQFTQINKSDLDELVGLMYEKDIHVVVTAKKSQANFLTSLNRKHLLENKQVQSIISARIVSPGELIRHLNL